MKAWQKENEKIMAITNKALDAGRTMTTDEMADVLEQIYRSAGELEMRITPLMMSKIAEIQYAIRSQKSQAAYDSRIQWEIDAK